MTDSMTAPAFDGRRIRVLRQQRGWSAEKLARRADISLRHMLRLEANERPNVSAVVVARLAQALNVSTDELLGVTAGSEVRVQSVSDPENPEPLQ